MSTIDRWFVRLTRSLARRSSRRSVLAQLAGVLVGSAALPLLPVARAFGASPVPGEPHPSTPSGDPGSCDYWRHCAIDGFLCACCGGSQNTCPPGTEMSSITWIGTCKNPADGKEYVISYNDCCGQSVCGRCNCTRTEGEKPVYITPKNNDALWCFGTKSRAVQCSVAVVLGVATESS